MKKILMLLSVMSLTACDKPTSVADLSCYVDKYWHLVNPLYLNNAYGDFDRSDTEISLNVVTYEDYAKITVYDITTVFEKVKERKDSGEFGYVDVVYKGNFPGSERTALLHVYADITNKQILQYTLNFVGQKVSDGHGREFSVANTCLPVKEEYKGKSWNAAVPFNHNYKMPNKIEKCITEIVNNVVCYDGRCTQLYLRNGMDSIPLTQQDALSLSKNWDYSNIKLYQNDGVLEDYEKDACEVLYNIRSYLDSINYKVIQKALADCGDNCNTAVATGDMGDYVLQIPMSENLYDIVNAKRDSKFVSAQVPEKEGYCFVNVVSKDIFKKDKDCYRIYCGSREDIKSNEFYAVQICE